MKPPTIPRGLPEQLEDLSPYLKQVSCDPAAMPGALALGDLLRATYPGTSYSVGRPCGVDGMASEHYEGRAVDWFVSVRDPMQARRAQAVLDWLLAPDAAGRPYANARRLGVMYLIWNDRIWGSYAADAGWRAYSVCAARPERGYDTGCHRDHIHISLSWAGGRRQTSFWSGRLAATDYGPCAPADQNWAPPSARPRTQPCPPHPGVSAPAGASPTLAALVRYSGATVGLGATGPVVRAVQQGLGLTPDGGFGPVTADAVGALQRSRALPATGRMDAATWRALVAARSASAPPPTPPAPPAPPPAVTSSSADRSSPLRAYSHLVLARGDRGPAVVAAQRALGVRPASGWFGPVTRAAVISFQARKGIRQTGQVGPITWRALGA